MTFITTVDEIVDLFPPGSVDVSEGELHSPCPFCSEGGTRVTYRGVSFWGEDRLIWFSDRAGVSCRRCGTYAPMQRLVDLLAPGSEVSSDLAPTEIIKEITEPVVAATEYINKLHAKVDRDYWRALNWTDGTIDHFNLGYGRMYEFGSVQVLRHVIPFHPQRIDRVYDGYAFEGRLPKDDKSGEKPNIKTKGMAGGGWFWFIYEDPSSTQVAITEGLKDGITAWQLGYKNVFCVFGTGAWINTFASYLSNLGLDTAHIFGDNDDAGRDLNEQISIDLHGAGIRPYALAWNNAFPDKFDITDVLKTIGQDLALRFLQENLKLTGQVRGRVKDYRTVDPGYQAPSTITARPLEQIREELPEILEEFTKGYKIRRKAAKRGVVKVLAAPPGSGKSYSLVAFAQAQARKIVEEHELILKQAGHALEQAKADVKTALDLEQLTNAQGFVDRIERGIANASQAKILFAAPFVNGWEDIINQPGFDASLWYNFKARNEETCENHETAAILGSKGYAVAKFCETQCPFAERCRQVGYLKQERERKQKPITFVRHANLVSDSLLVGYKIIIIDENFLDVFASFIEVDNFRDLMPSRQSWADYEEDNFQQIEYVNHFLEAVRKTLSVNVGKGEAGLLSGLSYLHELELNLGQPLISYMKRLDPAVVKHYQPITPPAFDKVTELPRRIVEPLYSAIMEELKDCEKGAVYNSRIHQIDGKLIVSTLFPLKIPASKPIIVSDGTAFAELYGYIFNRTVEIYSPEMYNPEAVIEQLQGNDFTRAAIRRQLGNYAYNKLASTIDDVISDEVPDILGEKISLADIPVTEDLFDSPALNRILALLLEFAGNPDFEKVLFVTYKTLRAVFEKRLQELSRQSGPKKAEYKALLSKLAFGHYGGLRGTNRYKDYDAVMLAGCPRIPYRDVHFRVQAWARLAGKADYIPYNIIAKPAPYHGIEMYEGYVYYTFEDEFADRFVQMYEEGEIRQCLDRIRVYSGGKKYAQLLMGRPAAKWVTLIDNSGRRANLATEVRFRPVLDFMQTSDIAFGKLPAASAVAKKFGLSRSQAKKLLERYKTEKKALISLS